VAIITACLPSIRILVRSSINFCKGHGGESQRLRNLSNASTMPTDETLMERPRTPRTLNYDDCMLHEKGVYGAPLKKYPSTTRSPSLTSPSTGTHATAENV